MLGKRPRPLQRASSKPHLMLDDTMSIRVPNHLAFDTAGPPAPALAGPRQVIGFNPVIKDVDAGGSPRSVLEANALLGIGNGCSMPGKQARSPRSPRSGLESLLSSPRPWDKKEGERVGLGIVVALHTAEGDSSSKARGVVETSKGLLANAGPVAQGMPPNVFQHLLPLCPKESRPIPIAQASHVSTRDYRGHQQRRVVEEEGEDGCLQDSFPWTSSKVVRCPFNRQEQPSLCCAPVDMEVDNRESIFSTASPASSFNEKTCPLPAIDFLNACYFCKRHLGPGKDIYMYRGDRAFCSAECRYQQIVIDERKERCSSAALKASTVGASIRSGTSTKAYAH